MTARPRGTVNSEPTAHTISLRLLVLLAFAAGVCLLSWRYPVLVNPVLLAVTVYAVLDKLIADDKVAGE